MKCNGIYKFNKIVKKKRTHTQINKHAHIHTNGMSPTKFYFLILLPFIYGGGGDGGKIFTRNK